jgi:pyrrolidone-carboxylate peptidase
MAIGYTVTDDKIEFVLHRGRAKDLDFLFDNNNTDRPPNVPLKTSDLEVDQGIDPGNFYCEHIFFEVELEAARAESSVLSNHRGEKLVGFLHVPSDAYADGTVAPPSESERQAKTRRVIAAALRGFYDELLQQMGNATPSLLLTGYDRFMTVVNNPTGEFVSHKENLDASMAIAFGPNLVTPEGQLVGALRDAPEGGATFRYQLKTQTGTTREVLLSAVRFPVDDTTISASSGRSIQTAMRALSPSAVICMGVADSVPYLAEHRADSGGMRRSPSDSKHDDSQPDKARLEDNFALARAIQAGASRIG